MEAGAPCQGITNVVGCRQSIVDNDAQCCDVSHPLDIMMRCCKLSILPSLAMRPEHNFLGFGTVSLQVVGCGLAFDVCMFGRTCKCVGCLDD